MPVSERRRPNHADDDDDVGYVDLDRLARYSGLSVSSLRRHLKDPVNPLPHHEVRSAGKTRGRVLVRKDEFDAWVRSFGQAPREASVPKPATDVRWIRRAFGR